MELPAYLPITSDYGFKVTFGNPHNTEFLRRALQALIGSAVPIREVTLEPTTFAGITPDSRGGIYDMSCVDEQGRHFIVEMQVAQSPDFIQRLKFYAFHKLNTLVQRGQQDWGSLPPIYCIALLSKGILPGTAYHTVANLRTETGELLDRQLTFVLAELDKFHLPAADVHTDLEKLLFTMQNVDNPLATLENRPDFWEESWLRDALHELSTRNMPPEQYEQMMRAMGRRSAILQQEERWANGEKRLIAAEQHLADAQAQAQAAEQQAADAQAQAQAAQAQAQAAQAQAQAAEQQAQAAEQQAQAAEQQAAATEQQAQAALETTVRNLLNRGGLRVEEIASICGLTPEQVRRLQPQ